jgi:hypothetical protein
MSAAAGCKCGIRDGSYGFFILKFGARFGGAGCQKQRAGLNFRNTTGEILSPCSCRVQLLQVAAGKSGYGRSRHNLVLSSDVSDSDSPTGVTVTVGRNIPNTLTDEVFCRCARVLLMTLMAHLKSLQFDNDNVHIMSFEETAGPR